MMSSSAKENQLSGCREKKKKKKEKRKVCCRGANSGMLPHPWLGREWWLSCFILLTVSVFPPFVFGEQK